MTFLPARETRTRKKREGAETDGLRAGDSGAATSGTRGTLEALFLLDLGRVNLLVERVLGDLGGIADLDLRKRDDQPEENARKEHEEEGGRAIKPSW